MFNRILSKYCNHSEEGVCSVCILEGTFNLDSKFSNLSIQNPPSNQVHVETPVSEAASNSEDIISDCKDCSTAEEISASLLKEKVKQESRMEVEFLNSLISIGNKLNLIYPRDERSKRLICELFLLNLRLPARVWLPLYSDSTTHLLVRIPYTEGCVLNSKNRTPYCIYCEVIEVENVETADLPEKNVDEQVEQISLIKSINESTSNLPENSETVRKPQLISCRSEPVLNAFDAQDDATALFGGTQSAIDPNELNNKPMSGIAKIRQRLPHFKRKRKTGLARIVDDPSASVMSEPWEEKERRIKEASPYGKLPGWKLLPVIVKTGDDLRQELLAYHLLVALQEIWQAEDIPLHLHPYKIIVCSHDSGMLEPIVNSCSLHQIKKNILHKLILDDMGQLYPPTLLSHFIIHYGPQSSESFQFAQQNFIRSCAAYSLACYYLQVKDRHNGNILLDSEGHLIHIDFGYILTISPKNLGFETSPFKLTSELVDVMGGLDSESFANFRELLFDGMLAVRKHYKKIMSLVDVKSNNSLPCFQGGNNAVNLLFDRFHIGCNENELRGVVNGLVDQSRDSLTTRLYDNFQYFTNGIF